MNNIIYIILSVCAVNIFVSVNQFLTHWHRHPVLSVYAEIASLYKKKKSAHLKSFHVLLAFEIEFLKTIFRFFSDAKKYVFHENVEQA